MEKRQRAWAGGEIRRIARKFTYRTDAKGNVTLDTEVVDFGVDKALPFGTGLALLEPAEMQLPNDLWLRAEVRDGRPQCVAIESREGGPPITAQSLRFALDREMQTLVRTLTVRITIDDDTGEIIGEHATSPSGPGETRTVADRVADVDRAARTGRRGRPPLTDEFLKQVAIEWDNAQRVGEAASYAVAALHGEVSPATVRQWMFKARKRGLVPEEEEENDG